ncbi:MAG TPA: response regulator transcription factor [Verrucomicrobiota bacterium]|nr:response regulator transcription factor [Verrucomicrobiota bacterium]
MTTSQTKSSATSAKPASDAETSKAGRPASATAGSKGIGVSIVEDNARVRQSLQRLIQSSPGFNCLSVHPTAEAALEQLPATKPDVVLMDINLPGMNGVECVRQLKLSLPKTQVVMLTVYENTDVIFKALAAGASGYLLKQTPPPELLSAVRDVHNGGSPMSSHIARKVVASFQQPSSASAELATLTGREQEVLDYLAKGFLYKEIAATMHISYDTVHTHIRNIYEKLHVRSRTEAVAKRLSQGMPAQ